MIPADVRASTIDEYRFKQVSDEKRAAICKKMPKFLLGFLLAGGLLYLVRHNSKVALSLETDTNFQIRDAMNLDANFFVILLLILGSIFIAEWMMVI